VALGWLLLVALVAVLALRQEPRLDSSILSLLPESEQSPAVRRASEQLGREYSERLLLVLSGPDEPALRRAVAAMGESLSALEQVKQVDWRVDERDLAKLRGELFPWRFALLDDGLRQRLQRGEFEHLRERALAHLYAPMAGGDSLIDDPFGLYFEFELNRRPQLNLQISDSLLEVNGASLPGYLLVVTLAQDPFAPATQDAVLGAIEQQRRLSPAIETLAMSGMLVHAAAGARQAKGEISTIGLGSLLGIVIAMLLVFGRLRPLLLLLFPVAVGCLFAAAGSLLIFERVHLVTFAFGAGLVGVSVDYALHFLCERQVSPAQDVLSKIMPGLLLGLFSSVAAYAAQAMTPFPGLRQMAVFSVLGLGAAWLTVVLWLPLLTGTGQTRPLALADRLERLRQRFPKLADNPWLVAVLLVVLGLAGLSIWNGEARDDIRLLQTSPQALLDQERALHQALGSSSGSRFLLVTADSLEACLQLEESLREALQGIQRDGLIEGFQMLSSSLPSLASQAKNATLVEQLYERELEPLFARIKLSPAKLAEARAVFEQAAARRLTPQDWLQLASSREWRNLLLPADNGAAASIIRLQGEMSEQTLQLFTRMEANLDGLAFVDRVQTISSLLGKYREQVAGWVLIAYLVVFVVLFLRYRHELWRIILPPLAASLITLAILMESQQGINLFHMMALILVLGIGLDMGIFLAESGEAPHTWLAVSLSAFTSLLAFGLLAASNTPVLHHFGLTVALGLSLVWLLAPLTRRGE
jgi:predicted exporter